MSSYGSECEECGSEYEYETCSQKSEPSSVMTSYPAKSIRSGRTWEICSSEAGRATAAEESEVDADACSAGEETRWRIDLDYDADSEHEEIEHEEMHNVADRKPRMTVDEFLHGVDFTQIKLVAQNRNNISAHDKGCCSQTTVSGTMSTVNRTSGKASEESFNADSNTDEEINADSDDDYSEEYESCGTHDAEKNTKNAGKRSIVDQVMRRSHDVSIEDPTSVAHKEMFCGYRSKRVHTEDLRSLSCEGYCGKHKEDLKFSRGQTLSSRQRHLIQDVYEAVNRKQKKTALRAKSTSSMSSIDEMQTKLEVQKKGRLMKLYREAITELREY